MVGWSVRQSRDCSTYIANAAGQPPATQLLAYDSSTATQIFTHASIFTTLEEADCGVTTCALYVGGGSCNVAYTAVNNVVIMDPTSYNIIAKRNVVAGYAA